MEQEKRGESMKKVSRKRCRRQKGDSEGLFLKKERRRKMQEQTGKILEMDGGMKKSQRAIRKKKVEGSQEANEMIARFSSYLKAHNIQFARHTAEDGTPQITMVFKNCDMCPWEITEGCIFFHDDSMEARVYYSELGAEICRDSEKRPDLYRLMNFLHARVWPMVAYETEDGIYSSQNFCPRFYVTEDERFDITAAIVISYFHYELDELQTEDFITAALPDLLDRLSIPIFFLLGGKITLEEAIGMVKNDILCETEDAVYSIK